MVVIVYAGYGRYAVGSNLCGVSGMTEADLQAQVADYLRLQYPDVLFHSDFGSGIKLTPGQAVKQKRQNGGRRAWLDMFIAEPVYWRDIGDVPYFLKVHKEFHDIYYVATRETDEYSAYGLFLELKKDGTRLKKKNGEWATKHIAEQADVLEKLRERGYCAEFAVGFDEAKEIIDEYLGGVNES